MNSRKRKIIVALGTVAAAILLYWCSDREPVYLKKPVSYWFKLYVSTQLRVAAFSPDGRVVTVSPGTGDGVRLWSANGQLIRSPGHDGSGLSALKAMGADAVPYLVTRLKARDSVFNRTYRAWWSKLPLVLKNRLPGPTDAAWIRASAAYALGELGSAAAAATGPLTEALHDKDPDVRLNVDWALQRINPRAAESENWR